MVDMCWCDVQKGTTSVLIANLPGFPDGVSVAEDGNFWITLAGTGHQPLVKLLPYRSYTSQFLHDDCKL